MFNKMLTKANDIWDEFTTGKKHKMRHDQQRQKQPEKPIKPQTPNDAKKLKTPVLHSTKAQTCVNSSDKQQDPKQI